MNYNKLMFVENDRDEVLLLKEDQMHFDKIIAMVNELFARGVKFVGLETDEVRIYFDSAKGMGNQAITGKFKDKKVVR